MKSLKLLFVSLALIAFSSFYTIPYRAVSASTSVTSSDDGGVVLNTGAAVTFTFTGTFTTGVSVRIVNHGTGNITLSPAVTTQNGKTITTVGFDATTIDANIVGNSIVVVYDGTTWRKL